MKVKKETSVTRKLIIYFLLSNMVIAIIGTTIGLYNEVSNYKKSVLTRFKKIERVNVPLLAEAIFHKNEKKIKQIIQNIKTWEDLTTLELTRLSHRSLEKKSPPHFSQHKDQKFLSHKLDIIYHKKGSQEKILVGNLLLKVSMSKMVQFLKNKVQTFILIQLVQFGLITIVLFALFYQLISKHLEKVFLYAQNLDINFRSNHDLTLDRKPSVHEDELDKVVDSINKMKKNVFDSHGDLQKYTTNLEEKVFQKTTAHSDAKKNMEYLLHNMRQAIFTVDENGTIEGPVSSFSKKIFESDIEGKNIFETIFSCLHEKSETYCSIKFANSCNFGSDKVQWNLILDQYPTKIILTKKKFDLEKILKINYTPLWNEKGLLFKIMYIVEDTTEIEKLESEMKDQKDEANKNVKVLQELGLNKKEDLQVFFSNIIKLSLESQALTKEIRSQIEKGEKKTKGLQILLRNLHTMKGNSRIFGFSYLSTFLHGLENLLSRFLINPEKNIKKENLNNFLQNLYVLHGEINIYLNSGREIFGIDFKEDTDFKEYLHKSMITFELLMSKIFKRNLELSDYKQCLSHHPSFFNEIRKVTHTLKALTRSLNEKSLSSVIHQFEQGIEFIGNEDYNEEEIQNNLITPFKEITEKTNRIYFKSTLYRPLIINPEQWVQIFLDSFDLTKSFLNLKKDRKSFLKSFYNFKGHLDPLKISFFNLTIDLIQNVLNQKQEKSDRDIKHYIDTIWHFLALVSQIDIGKIQKDPEKKETIFNKVLIELKNKDIEKKKFSETLSQFFKNEDFSLENFLIPSSQFSYYINEIYSDLKQNISIKNIELIRRSEKDLIDSSFLELLGLLFKEDQGPWGSYIIRINVLQLMASYTEREAGNVEKVSKPEVVEILSKNFNLFKEVIGSLNLNKNKQEVLDFEQRFNALFEQPVKYSFKKFFPVIQEMSEVMNKKVNFTLKGDQGSLDKDKLTLLNDSIVHILRNALDHGIEQPDQRISIGKEEIGHIEIKCTEEKNEYLEIVIKDDGKGISGDFILKNALEKGLLMEKQSLSLNNKEKINLIFLPNFSTKNTISQISGRGIGLDIVKYNLEKVGAQLSIDSKVGQGTTITIKIPKNFQINSKVS